MAFNDDSEKWNMAMAYYMRLDALLSACTNAQMNGDGVAWYKAIYRLYVEIQAKMKPEVKTKAKELMDSLTALKLEKSKEPNGSIPTAKFVEVELYLRQILEDKNMLTPKNEDLSGL